MKSRFALAPMSRSIAWLTGLLFLLPAGFFYLALRRGSPPLVMALFVTAIYVLVWLYFRPTRFELSPWNLTVVWPVRRFRLPFAEISHVEALTSNDFRDRYGRGMRVGAGGLWGGFGLLLTREGALRFYISRLDGYILVHSRTQRPLLITPEQPEVFLQTLRLHLQGAEAVS